MLERLYVERRFRDGIYSGCSALLDKQHPGTVSFSPALELLLTASPSSTHSVLVWPVHISTGQGTFFSFEKVGNNNFCFAHSVSFRPEHQSFSELCSLCFHMSSLLSHIHCHQNHQQSSVYNVTNFKNFCCHEVCLHILNYVIFSNFPSAETWFLRRTVESI